ncbi:DUF4926 domain-containing protein [Dolichospermum sp. ST_sed1]|nr:DUF4926 domain-containing protein [Dolichospermum sp. ST_sed1]MDD1428057.1 DUF4926 domain-containing protein [Dolichospermum sp. ST_sed9]MDD1434301.1 DUF4926 domain-containing protein [Dolichospermum sp. ST_sed6]MDD1457935.1 DUF4926 domain-containing protein [Dolichospermum sp. ST_sed7]MDD1463233.1 DUF4926 domain-containing protein [Dolichospermum sp. ST_sed2]MDD1468557.1 DUF4926 domain-containing protein [Dolichospermum sp. ST_sed5]MDD1470262.1 DUF4926 domain-containing protein [Dolichosp
MDFPLYSNIILLRDIPEECIYSGDIGIIVDQHNVPGLEMGYSVEFFDMIGNTVAVVTLPMSYLRSPTHANRPAVRLIPSLSIK